MSEEKTMQAVQAENSRLKFALEQEKERSEQLWQALREAMSAGGRMKVRLEALEGRASAPTASPVVPQHPANMAELEAKYAPVFDGNSPSFNLTKASIAMREHPEVGQRLIDRFQATWNSGKYAKVEPGWC